MKANKLKDLFAKVMLDNRLFLQVIAVIPLLVGISLTFFIVYAYQSATIDLCVDAVVIGAMILAAATAMTVLLYAQTRISLDNDTLIRFINQGFITKEILDATLERCKKRKTQRITYADLALEVDRARNAASEERIKEQERVGQAQLDKRQTELDDLLKKTKNIQP